MSLLSQTQSLQPTLLLVMMRSSQSHPLNQVLLLVSVYDVHLLSTAYIALGTVEAVQTEIKGLHRRFNSLKELTIQGLERCRVTVVRVVYILTTILTVQEHK